jgi:two-component system cell cycle sensor histidine kinase/response regulator CckA
MIQFFDISEQKSLERQFIQSQKMRTIGQLTGGIAHDFNNLLTAILGFSDLLLQRYLPTDPFYSDLFQIKQNANRASNLVQQLLAFLRQEPIQPKILHIQDVLIDLSSLLRRLININIDLQLFHVKDLWPVHVDQGLIEQVIINLVINARDAMPNGGTIVIRTGNYTIQQFEQIGASSLKPGDYLLIEVIDTGIGIEEKDLGRIFEPFFSLKKNDGVEEDDISGIGLGLSTVFGIIKQTDGFIHVESEINHGTIFKIFFPRFLNAPVTSHCIDRPQHERSDLRGEETILLVEDEDSVRLFSARALRDKGYRVLEARSSQEAVSMIQEGIMFDLLITDVLLPQMEGTELFEYVRSIYPETKVLFISGYMKSSFRNYFDENPNVHFLPKPFTLKELTLKVKDILSEGIIILS